MSNNAKLADDLRYIASILEVNASKFAVPDHISQKARKCRVIADLLENIRPQHERLLEEIAREASIANDVIRLGRERHGSGRIRVATALHRIGELAARALETTPAPVSEREVVLQEALTKISDMGDAEIYANPAAVKRLVRAALTTSVPVTSTHDLAAVLREARDVICFYSNNNDGSLLDKIDAILSRLGGDPT